MTLITTGHNDKDIVIGADSLTTVDIDGVRQPDITSEKVFVLNKSTALGLSGLFTATSKQFIVDFVYNHKGERDLLVLRDKLVQNAEATLTLDSREILQITLVGYVDNAPQIKLVVFEPGKTPGKHKTNDSYFVIGFDGPRVRAKALLEEKGIQTKPRTKDIKAIIEDTLKICIDEFKNSKDEKLGGKPFIKVLRR